MPDKVCELVSLTHQRADTLSRILSYMYTLIAKPTQTGHLRREY